MRSKRFKPLVNFAQHGEREAAKALGEALKELNTQIIRFQQLNLYKSEYNQRLSKVGSNGISVNKLNEFRQFLSNIDLAIEAQQLAVENAEITLQEKKKFWFSKRGRSKAMDNVLDRYETEEKQQLEKREQREMDDRVVSKSSQID